jgi:hypothetical protein
VGGKYFFQGLLFRINNKKGLYQERSFMMIGHFILVGLALAAVFIMFLVLSRTLNNVINLLIKLQYLVQRDFDLKKEMVDVRNLMAEDAAAENGPDGKK